MTDNLENFKFKIISIQLIASLVTLLALSACADTHKNQDGIVIVNTSYTAPIKLKDSPAKPSLTANAQQSSVPVNQAIQALLGGINNGKPAESEPAALTFQTRIPEHAQHTKQLSTKNIPVKNDKDTNVITTPVAVNSNQLHLNEKKPESISQDIKPIFTPFVPPLATTPTKSVRLGGFDPTAH